MADTSIFAVQPPAWLQRIAQPVGTEIGEAIGTIGAGMARGALMRQQQGKEAARTGDQSKIKPAWQNYLKGFSLATLSQEDPMFELRQQGLATGIASTQARMSAQMAQNKWLQQEHDWATEEMPKIAEYAADPTKPLPIVKSQAGMRALENVLRTVTVSDGVKDFSKSVDELRKLDPVAASKYAQFIGKPVKPDVFNQLGADLDKARKEHPTAVSPLGKLQKDRADALARGDNEAVAQYDAAINELVTNKGKSVYMGMDDQGRPVFQFTEGGAKPIGTPTVGMQTFAQENLAKAKNAVQIMEQLQLTPEMVGVRGLLGEWVVDRSMAQLTGKAEGSRVEGRTLMRLLREGVLKQVTESSRYSQQDRKEIEEIFPSSGLFESADRANKALKTIADIFRRRAKVYSESIRAKPMPWMLDDAELHQEYPTKESIKDLYDKGAIGFDEALDALKRGY